MISHITPWEGRLNIPGNLRRRISSIDRPFTLSIAAVNEKTVKRPLDFESMDKFVERERRLQLPPQGHPHRVPVSGRHEDLHAPTDDAEKIDYEKVQRLSQLIYEVTAEHARSLLPVGIDERGRPGSPTRRDTTIAPPFDAGPEPCDDLGAPEGMVPTSCA